MLQEHQFDDETRQCNEKFIISVAFSSSRGIDQSTVGPVQIAIVIIILLKKLFWSLHLQ